MEERGDEPNEKGNRGEKKLDIRRWSMAGLSSIRDFARVYIIQVEVKTVIR